jgi:hypothetical protein
LERKKNLHCFETDNTNARNTLASTAVTVKLNILTSTFKKRMKGFGMEATHTTMGPLKLLEKYLLVRVC